MGGGLNFFSTCEVKCAHEWIYFEPTNKCYKYFTKEKYPTDANDYCLCNFKVKLTKRDGFREIGIFGTFGPPPYYALNCGNLAFRPVDRRPHPISGSMALTVDRGLGHQQPIGGCCRQPIGSRRTPPYFTFTAKH